jgi:hypothetical protein
MNKSARLIIRSGGALLTAAEGTSPPNHTGGPTRDESLLTGTRQLRRHDRAENGCRIQRCRSAAPFVPSSEARRLTGASLVCTPLSLHTARAARRSDHCVHPRRQHAGISDGLRGGTACSLTLTLTLTLTLALALSTIRRPDARRRIPIPSAFAAHSTSHRSERFAMSASQTGRRRGSRSGPQHETATAATTSVQSLQDRAGNVFRGPFIFGSVTADILRDANGSEAKCEWAQSNGSWMDQT